MHISQTNSAFREHTVTFSRKKSVHPREDNGCVKHPALKGLKAPDLWHLHLKPHSTATVCQLTSGQQKHLLVANNYDWVIPEKQARCWSANPVLWRRVWKVTSVWVPISATLVTSRPVRNKCVVLWMLAYASRLATFKQARKWSKPSKSTDKDKKKNSLITEKKLPPQAERF